MQAGTGLREATEDHARQRRRCGQCIGDGRDRDSGGAIGRETVDASGNRRECDRGQAIRLTQLQRAAIAGGEQFVLDLPAAYSRMYRGSSPMLDSSDVSVLAELADMVLFVADARHSTRAQVRAALQELDPVRDKVIGCVLDNVGRRPLKPARPIPPRPDRNADPVVQGPPAGAKTSTTSTQR